MAVAELRMPPAFGVWSDKVIDDASAPVSTVMTLPKPSSKATLIEPRVLLTLPVIGWAVYVRLVGPLT